MNEALYIPSWITGITALLNMVFIFVVIFRRNSPIDETLQDYAKEEDINSIRAEFREDLKRMQDEWQRNCLAKHENVSESLKELYKENKTADKDVSRLLTELRKDLNSWQQGIERQLGNQDGRINNLEEQMKRSK